MGLGLGVLVGVAVSGFRQHRRRRSWLRTTGTVQDVGEHSGRGRRTAYFPIVRFTGPRGETVEFESPAGTQHEYYRKGAAVAVLFNPRRPREAMIDQFFMRWGPQFFMTIAGIMIFICGLAAWAG